MLYFWPRLDHGPIYFCINVKSLPLWPTYLAVPSPPTPLSSLPLLSALLRNRHRIYEYQKLAILYLYTPLYIPSCPSIMVKVYCYKGGHSPGQENKSSVNVQVGTRTWYSASRSYLNHRIHISISIVYLFQYGQYNWDTTSGPYHSERLASLW